MLIRKAIASDIMSIVNVERRFFGPLGLPPECEAGVGIFMKKGGRIIVCEENGYVHASCWIIQIRDLMQIKRYDLPGESPLMCVRELPILQRLDENGFIVYSWAGLREGSVCLFRKMKKIFRVSRYSFFGFVDCNNFRAIHNYLRMGCKVIGELPCLYSQMDCHLLLEYTGLLRNDDTYINTKDDLFQALERSDRTRDIIVNDSIQIDVCGVRGSVIFN